MADKTWKRIEREHARRLHTGSRLGPTGQDLPDSVSSLLAVESKSSRSIPQWLVEAVRQAQDNRNRWTERSGESPIPIVVLHPVGENLSNDLVVMTLWEFCARILPLLEGFMGPKSSRP